jgi:hypothetical protein
MEEKNPKTINRASSPSTVALPACPCCGLEASSRRLLVLVEVLQAAFPDLLVTSATRCERHNASPLVKGSPRSGHLPVWGEQGAESVAADIHLKVRSKQRVRSLAFAAVRAGAKGVGLYPWGLHIDLKPRLQLWKWREGGLEYFF